jgi:branched-chain amino acid transport system ATP-binding protein
MGLKKEIQTASSPLAVDKVSLSFGKILVLNNVSFQVYEGEILSIIGPNGAGKTSLLNCLSGFYQPDTGRITYKGEEITKVAIHRRASLGLGRNWPWVHREEIAHREVVEEIIDFLEMEAIRYELVGNLGYGLRKRVDLARALALEPKILVMDEPMAGMNMEEKEDMARFIIDIEEFKSIPIILVEHDMEVVMDISNRIMVLDWGNVIAEGKPEEIRTNPAVIKAYLGEADEEVNHY